MPSTREVLLRVFLLAVLGFSALAQEHTAAPTGSPSPEAQQPPDGEGGGKTQRNSTGAPPSMTIEMDYSGA